MRDEQAGGRRIVGFALAGSGAVLLIVAALIYTGTFGVAEESRTIASGALGLAAVLDLMLAVYFIVSAE